MQVSNNYTAAPDPVVTTPAATGANKQTLGQEDFLKLLAQQFQQQDPMKPMDDTAFISQMAQFTSLEQMQNLNQTMSQQAQFQNLSNASGMIGKYVSLEDTSSSSGSGLVTGQVDEVRMAGGKVSVVIGGQSYDASNITMVSPSAISDADAQAAAAAKDAADAAAAAKASAANSEGSGSAPSQYKTLSLGSPTTSALASPGANALATVTSSKYKLQSLMK